MRFTKIAADLRQTDRTEARRVAIVAFCKGLRRERRFQPLWDAVGGAPGLAALMAEFSLRDVKVTCHLLGRTASAPNARPARHAGLAELVRILYDEASDRDPRPLALYYQDIVPACGLDLVREWDEQRRPEWSKFQRLCLLRSHREWYEKKFMHFLFPPEGATQSMSFSQESKVFEGNLDLSEAILSALVADKEGKASIPRDFMPRFLMPLLNKLFRRRKSDGERRNSLRDKFLYLAVQCVQVHESDLAQYGLLNDREELLRCAVQRWSAARDKRTPAPAATQQQTELCLVRMIELIPRQSKVLYTLRQAFEMVLRIRKPHVDSYQLLRLILLHGKDYEFDIDDNTPSTIARLKDLTTKGNLWPAGLFLYLDGKEAIALFEKLSNIDATGSFLAPDRENVGSYTILDQKAFPDSPRIGDTEVVRCLLYAKSPERAGDESWRERARSLVHERRKMSEEGREWQQRSFWARSAISLCVALGDMELLDDTVLWARRFQNQPLVVRDYYNGSIWNTVEIRDLLSAVPEKLDDGEVASSERKAAVTEAIETSGRIIIHLMETINMTMLQPDAQGQDWGPLLKLPRLVIDRRLDKKRMACFDAFFKVDGEKWDYPSPGVLEAVWKPTIDLLIRVEALLCANTRLTGSARFSLPIKGHYVFQELQHKCGGKAMADLVTFIIERVKTHMGPEGFRQQMYNVVYMVCAVADSDQPWLAVPFIRDLVLHGDGADSAWHRQLLSPRFLSLLPSKSVRDLLYTMSEAIKEKMREQNARPDPPPQEVAAAKKGVGKKGKGKGKDKGDAAISTPPPVVKVTTIKMMAQLLQDTRVVGPSAACYMLLGLLVPARHIDSLVAVVNSLLAILKEPSYPPELHARVLDALEEKLPPVLSQLNERRPVREEEWAAAESTEMGMPDVREQRPLTSLLLDQDYGKENMAPEVRKRLVGLLLRAPEQTAVNNARWNDLFLRRNGFSLADSEKLPACHPSTYVLRRFLEKFPADVPAEIFATLRDMTLVNLRPPPGVARVTEAVQKDRDLVKSNAGVHWLAQWDVSGRQALVNFGIFHVVELLRDPPEALASRRSDGVTLEMLGDTVLTVAERLIACELTTPLQELVDRLGGTRPTNSAQRAARRENCVPVLKRLTEKVDGLRSGHVQLEGGEALPRVLPSSFRLRLSTLSMPYDNSAKEPATAQDLDVFAAEVSGLLEWLAARKLPYHEEFHELKRKVRSALSNEECARAALQFGRLGNKGVEAWGLADYLRLELVGDLLAEGKIPGDGGAVPKLREVVREWVRSDVEVVRAKGLLVEKKHKDVLADK